LGSFLSRSGIFRVSAFVFLPLLIGSDHCKWPHMLSRAAQRHVKDRVRDSRHWERYTPRAGDVVVATAPKVGTTWTQRIVSLLIFQSPAPKPIMQVSPWLDCRFQIPIDVMVEMLEAQDPSPRREIAPAVRCAADLRR
jgi:hypothetical protein